MNQALRHYSFLDQLCIQAEQGLKLVHGVVSAHNRPNPGDNHPQNDLSEAERKHIAGLMRVNHSGEVCAQALYFGQALLASRADLQAHLNQAALEEGDHLLWCQQRLSELGSHTSYLNPAWYTFSVLIGMLAATLGDEISLGFIVATEEQVEQHLQGHLDQLPEHEHKSRAIIEQMQRDEIEHGHNALNKGARELPKVVQNGMRLTAKVMTTLAYWV